jgi:hypothetical protein
MKDLPEDLGINPRQIIYTTYTAREEAVPYKNPIELVFSVVPK